MMVDLDSTDKTSDKKKRKSIIASLDLKNYKAKYTDSYGLGKPNEVDLDNFLIAEPDLESEEKKESEKIAEKNTPKFVSNPTTSTTSNIKSRIQPSESVVDKTTIKKAIETPNPAPIRDSDFERRVHAEADNDFYDDKPAQKTSNTFHSNVVKRRTDTENKLNSDVGGNSKGLKPNRKINIREPITVNVRHEIIDRTQIIEDIEAETSEKKPVRSTETYGIVLSAVAFVYSIFTKDKPLLFLSVSLLLYLLRPVIAAPFGKYSQSVQNAIKGFSMALFFGSIFFIFF